MTRRRRRAGLPLLALAVAPDRGAAASRGARRRAAGFSLLELLVTLVIVLLALSLAGRLLLESQVRLAHGARRALDPVAETVAKQLRADLRASATARASDFEWSWGPLVLDGHPAGTVTYRRRGTDLVRRLAPPGKPPSERVVARATSVFRWRLRGDVPLPLVEVELGLRRTPRLGLLGSGGVREAPVPSTRRLHLAVGPRRAAGRDGW